MRRWKELELSHTRDVKVLLLLSKFSILPTKGWGVGSKRGGVGESRESGVYFSFALLQIDPLLSHLLQ